MKFDPILIFVSIICFNLLVPLLAYGIFQKKNQLGVSLWASGCAILSSGYLLVFLRTLELPSWITYELAQFSIVSGFSLFALAFRKNLLLETKIHKIVLIIFFYLIIFSTLFRLDFVSARQIFAHSFYAIYSIFLLRYSLMLRKKTQSKSILICTLSFAISFSVDTIRVAAISFSYSSLNPIDLSWDSLMMAISIPISTTLINYGFFGFILEQIIYSEQRSNLEKQQALRDQTVIKQRKQALAEALKERDRMLEIASHASRLSTLDLLAANIAHELNQPLGAMMLDISILKNHYNIKELNPEVHNIIEDLDHDCQRINSVFSSIKSLSRQNHIEIEAISLSDVISAAIELVKGKAKDQNIHLSLNIPDTDLWIQGDTVLLIQVFLNIIVNAIHALSKPANTNGKICISVAKSDCNVIVIVDDNGPGFQPNIRHQLFNTPYTSKDHGTGIGLLLCHTIMKRLGGDIKINQNSAGGARIELTFLMA